MKVYEILEATKGILVSGNKEDDICFFSQDSRQMKNGGMYIPLKVKDLMDMILLKVLFKQEQQQLLPLKM